MLWQVVRNAVSGNLSSPMMADYEEAKARYSNDDNECRG